jgi:hypothetical protein
MTTHDTYPQNYNRATIMEESLEPWHQRMEELMDQDTRIIVLHGAGSANGIEPTGAQTIENTLDDYISSLVDQGTPVALIYEGEKDRPDRPDIGSVFGTLADRFQGTPIVTPIVVQTTSWYSPAEESSIYTSANNTPYETYVFDKSLPEIDPELQQTRGLAHSALTQSQQIVNYHNYEQVIVGPAGTIAAAQLHDLSKRAATRPQALGPVPVTVLSAHVNPVLEEGLRDSAQNDPSETRQVRAAEKITQRADYPYGMLCTQTGELALEPTDYPNLEFRPFVMK